jgi:hypothetical protein
MPQNFCEVRKSIMAGKWKAFAIWLMAPYIFFGLAAVTMQLSRDHRITLAPLLAWEIQAIVLSPCAITAVIGTIILWVLPIRRAWIGIIAGAVLAVAAIAVWALVEMTFFGGFEKNIGIFLVALTLSPPSCLAGAYAGLVRSREPQFD